jgi:hypothetical protein
MKKQSAITITFTPVESIIDEEVSAAIKPFIGKLRAAAEEDMKLEKHRDEAAPHVAAEQFDAAYSAAVLGDAAAERRIFDMGPKEHLVERQQQIYNVREQARVNAAIRNVDLFNKAAEAAIPAVQRASERAQAQHRSIVRTIGEPEKDSESIAGIIGWRINYLKELGENCRYGEGARGLLDRVSFTHLVLGEDAK